ncbi:MAG: hypothetical protein ACTSO9_03795 [Candidatus Helarchaeota archaeon]
MVKGRKKKKVKTKSKVTSKPKSKPKPKPKVEDKYIEDEENLKSETLEKFKEFYHIDHSEAEPPPIYESFKEILDSKNVDFFIQLFDSNDVNSRSWGFLGVFQLIAHKKPNQVKKILPIEEVQRLILEILKDNREISGVKGFDLDKMKINRLNVDKIITMDKEITVKPVFQYCMDKKTKTDSVVGNLLEYIVSKMPDPHTEPLLLQHAYNTDTNDFETKNHIVKAFSNFLEVSGQFEEKKKVNSILKGYLKDIKKDKTEFERIKGESDFEFEKRSNLIAKYKKDLKINIEKLINNLKSK